MVNDKELQNRLIELEKEFLTFKEREYVLNTQLKDYTTQQGVIGLKVINLQMEMEITKRKIEDVQAERARVCGMARAQGNRKQVAKKRKKV